MCCRFTSLFWFVRQKALVHINEGLDQSQDSCKLNKGLSFFVPQRRAPKQIDRSMDR